MNVQELFGDKFVVRSATVVDELNEEQLLCPIKTYNLSTIIDTQRKASKQISVQTFDQENRLQEMIGIQYDPVAALPEGMSSDVIYFYLPGTFKWGGLCDQFDANLNTIMIVKKNIESWIVALAVSDYEAIMEAINE
jgi:hypothetical protein